MNRGRMFHLFASMIVLTVVVVACAPAPTPATVPPTAAPAAPQLPAPTSAPATAVPAATQPSASTSVPPTAVPRTPTPAGPPTGGTLVVGLSYEPSKIDPHRAAADNAILATMQVCETLVIRKLDGSLVPGLATSWQISADGTQYTFKLRKDIKFTDGTPFNAEAVKYNLDRIMDPATKSEFAVDYLEGYTKTDVVDESTAVVNLKSPFAAFLGGLAEGWLCMVSPTAAKKWGPDQLQDNLVGTGPFLFKEWKRREYIRLERNPNYWGGAEFFGHRGNAYLDAILFKFVGEASVRSGTLETGEVQIAQELPTVDVKRLSARSDLKIMTKPTAGTGIMLLFNMSKAPTDDIKVRQAMEYAIEQKAISETLYQGIYGPSYGPLSPPTPFYWSGVEKMYPYDLAKAKALLDEAGWKLNPSTGIREKNGTPMRLDFPTHGGFPVYRDPAPIVQAQLKEVGIDVNVMNLAAPAWLEAGRKGTANIGIVDWRSADADSNLRQPFLSKNATAFAWNHHKNAKLDDLLMQGMTVTDPNKRRGIYEEVQKIIMEDAMIKPINLYTSVWGARNNVKGLKVDELAAFWFWAFDAYLEK